MAERCGCSECLSDDMRAALVSWTRREMRERRARRGIAHARCTVCGTVWQVDVRPASFVFTLAEPAREALN